MRSLAPQFQQSFGADGDGGRYVARGPQPVQESDVVASLPSPSGRLLAVVRKTQPKKPSKTG